MYLSKTIKAIKEYYLIQAELNWVKQIPWIGFTCSFEFAQGFHFYFGLSKLWFTFSIERT